MSILRDTSLTVDRVFRRQEKGKNDYRKKQGCINQLYFEQ